MDIRKILPSLNRYQTMAGQDGSLLQTNSALMFFRHSKRLIYQFQMKLSMIAIQGIRSISQVQLLCKACQSLGGTYTLLIIDSGHIGLRRANLRCEELQCFCKFSGEGLRTCLRSIAVRGRQLL